MAIADVVTRGYGSFSSVDKIPTLGYSIGAAVVTLPGSITISPSGPGSASISSDGPGSITIAPSGPGSISISKKTS